MKMIRWENKELSFICVSFESLSGFEVKMLRKQIHESEA